eukprot:Rhum_TRINITY_DN5255_c0_g1::Rhum_TRINITY_DN5255_c0_g1_i1::g.16954::m.16954
MFRVCRPRYGLVSARAQALATKRGGNLAYAVAATSVRTGPEFKATATYWDRLYSLGMQPWMQEVRERIIGFTQAPPSSPSPLQVLEDLTVDGNAGKGMHLADKHCAFLLLLLQFAFRSLTMADPRDERLIEDEVLSVAKAMMKAFDRHHEVGKQTVTQYVRLLSDCASFAQALHAVPGTQGVRTVLHVAPTTAHFNTAFRALLRRTEAFPWRVRVGLDSMVSLDVAPNATTLIVLHSVYARGGGLACVRPSLAAAIADEASWVQRAVRSPWYYYCVGMALQGNERAEWVEYLHSCGAPPLPTPLSALYVSALPLSDALRTAHGALDAVGGSSFDEFLRSDPAVGEDDLWCYTGEAEAARVRRHLAAQIMKAALEKDELSAEQRHEEYVKLTKRAPELTRKAVKVGRFVAKSLGEEFMKRVNALQSTESEDDVADRHVAVTKLEELLERVVSMNLRANDKSCVFMRKRLSALKRAGVATNDAKRA